MIKKRKKSKLKIPFFENFEILELKFGFCINFVTRLVYTLKFVEDLAILEIFELIKNRKFD